MTLEDFFTLTEMKNGLTTPARVEELLSMIQRQNACATNNGGDATRQRSTVASTLASTENQDCLRHFIYLNGLCFLNQWLHEASKCRQEVSDAEELINLLLGSLEKLPVEWKKLSSSGILVTIEKLFGHESAGIKFRAQALLEWWNSKRYSDCGYKETEETCFNHVDSSKPSASIESIDDKHDIDKKINGSPCENLVGDGICRQESGMGAQIRSPNNNLQSDITEKLPVNSSVAPVEMVSSSTPVSPEFQLKDGDEYITSAPKVDDDIDPEISTGICDSYESGQRESGCLLSSTSPTASSPAKRPILARSASLILESVEGEFNMSEPVEINRISTSEGEILMDEPTQKVCNEAFIFGDHSRTTKVRDLDKKLEFELESVDFDALEVARLVAIEVEREVVDYREQSCSSSTDVSLRDIGSSLNTDTAANKQNHQIIEEPNENVSMASEDGSGTTTSPKNDSPKFSEEAIVCNTGMQILEPPDQKLKSCCKSLKLKCEFDLNEDIFSEDLEAALYPIPNNPINLLAPIAVSASKGAPGWAVTPLHFEGEVGWRGSAATSAFRPASPRRALDDEKKNRSSKLRGNMIEIDLNVADSESDIAYVLKELPVSYCNLSRDSSIDISSGRAARMHLDLNSLGDEEAPSLQSSLLSHHHQKGSTSLSPTSSSSSMKPSMKNFNLNDNPIVLDGICNTSIAYGVRVDDPFFTIMGAKVSVERRDHTNQVHQAWMGSGLNWDAVMAGRPLVPYAQQVPPSGYAYNGLGMVPAFPFQPAMYANSNMPRVAEDRLSAIMPRMAEDRSSAIMPQLIGSSSSHGASVLSTQPFLMSISSTPPSLNGGEPSNPALDLNREDGSLKHFFMPGRSKLLEDQIKTASQQSSSATPPLKRKEPDSRWEPTYGYQVTSWH